VLGEVLIVDLVELGWLVVKVFELIWLRAGGLAHLVLLLGEVQGGEWRHLGRAIVKRLVLDPTSKLVKLHPPAKLLVDLGLLAIILGGELHRVASQVRVRVNILLGQLGLHVNCGRVLAL